MVSLSLGSVIGATDPQTWMGQGIPLQDLLAADHGYDEVGVPAAFGDRFLCANNPIHQQVRRLLRFYGYSFSSVANDLHTSYSTLPLLMIQDIIDAHMIPVCDTTGVLTRLLSENPELAIPPAFLLSNLRRNYLLHESAHCVAYSVLSPLLAGDGDRKVYVLVTLCCEAYANSVERMAACAATSNTHRLLFTLGSYVDTTRSGLLRGCIRALGTEQTLLLCMLTFLRINRQLSWGPREVGQLVDAWRSGTDGADHSDGILMELLVEHCAADLNVNFIKNTTPVFFRRMHCEREYVDVCNGDLPYGINDGAMVELLRELAVMTCKSSCIQPISSEL